MATITSTVQFNVLFGTVSDDGQTAIHVAGAVPRPDGGLGCMYTVLRGQQVVPSQVFSHPFFNEFVATGQVTIQNPN
jgi:hypothetical protein